MAAALFAGAVGAVLGWASGVPAPFLTGPAAVVTAVSLWGVETHIPDWLRNTCFVMIGLSLGAGITPEVVASLPQWPVPLVTLTLGLVLIVFGGGALVQRMFGFDAATARLTAMPGHLSFVIALSASIRSDVRVVTVIQSLRVLLLTLVVPVVVALASDADLSMTAPITETLDLATMLLLAVLGVALGLVFLRLKVPAALVMAGMAVSGLAHGAGWVTGAPPAWVAIPTFTIMGSLIGTRFNGVTFALIARAAAASGVLTGLAVAVTLGAALFVRAVTDLPLTDLLIAFAPGGLETMAALSIMLGADPAFTAAHHIYRRLFLSVLAPLAIAKIGKPD
ncbi:AbrB family transcriptional regulator [Roseibacterium beibuensis]|uniref:AbrB family transcriptional regulator n=1 Tax=[Roseibacterium] beibuensis TaxID=1193142 RepID=A0ABP9LJI9_9RHOB|nr:AbrB family transcriptional regulator [Roseibacterium beibuensis]